MAGQWNMTWHEDREISPGVPDLSYVMRGGDYEMGWLELKAGKDFEVESSQHRWIQRHLGLIPIHFLVALGDYWVLVDGTRHLSLEPGMKLGPLMDLSDNVFQPVREGDFAMQRWLAECLRRASNRRRKLINDLPRVQDR